MKHNSRNALDKFNKENWSSFALEKKHPIFFIKDHQFPPHCLQMDFTAFSR